MKKNFKMYAVCWAILLAVFNVICFVTPGEAAGMNKFGGAFWVGYIFITVAFIGQLVCAFIAFKAENMQRLFYNLPLITVSYTGLILTVIVGTLCMAIPDLPSWVGIIVCLLILAFNAIALIKASAAAEIVENIDEKIKIQTSFIKGLTAEAHSLLSSVTDGEISKDVKKVYETIRYSNPISNNATVKYDTLLKNEFISFADAVKNKDAELVKNTAESLVDLCNKRNDSI